MSLTGSVNPPQTTILELLRAVWIGPVLYAMADLGIADRLAISPQTSEEVAVATGCDAHAMSRLIRTLAAIGFCERDEQGRVHLTPTGHLMRSDVPGTFAPYVLAIHAPHVERAWAALPAAIRSGEPAFDAVHGSGFWDFLSAHPEDQALFDAAMAGGADRKAKLIQQTQDLTTVNTIVDVGGGSGAMLAAILATNPHLRGVLLDREEALADAGQVLRAAGVLERCDLVPGDFFASIPAGGDIYVLSLILHDWRDADAVRILESCHRAMTPGARIWLIENVLDAGDTFDSRKLLDMLMLILFGSQERDFDEYAHLLETAGFGGITHHRPGPGYSIVEAIC